MTTTNDGPKDDPFGLFKAVLGVRRRGPATRQRAFKLQRIYHERFVEATGVTCSWLSLQGQDWKTTIRYCYHPLCPSCWHRRQATILSTLAHLDAPVLYLRSIEGVWYRDPVPSKAMTAFKSKRQAKGVNAMRLVCWALAPYQQRIDPANAEQVDEKQRNLRHATYTRSTPRSGSCFYRLVGVFIADRPVINKHLPKRQRSINRLVDKTLIDGVTIERRRVASRDELADCWRELNPHPSHLHRHGLYAEYDRVLKAAFPKSYKVVGKANKLAKPTRPPPQKPFEIDAKGRVRGHVTAAEAERIDKKGIRFSRKDTTWTKNLVFPPPRST